MSISNHRDPYEEMERKLLTSNNVKALEKSLCSLTIRRRKADNLGGADDDPSKSSSPEEGQDYQDDDEEDFSSQDAVLQFPRVNGDSSSEHPQPRVAQLRDLQITVMEGICKQIDPKDLIGHIRDQGYLNHYYDNHARTVVKGLSKGGANSRRDISFLYSMLGRNIGGEV